MRKKQLELVDRVDAMKPPMSLDGFGWSSIGWKDSADRVVLNKLFTLTVGYYLCTNIMQRVVGKLGIHMGTSLPNLLVVGLASTVVSNIMAAKAADTVNKYEVKYDDAYGVSITSRKSSKERHYRRNTIKQVVISIGIFALLENKMFKTAVPSTLLDVGVYGTNRGSIFATSATASGTERLKIQSLGKLFGCHHCGNRQMLSRKTFIADHMPPTKIVKEKNKLWWRKMLKKVGILRDLTQRLYPQCQKCFSLQGSAVRTNTHELVYHFRPRIFHLAPALSYLLCTNRNVLIDFVDPVVNPIVNFIDNVI